MFVCACLSILIGGVWWSPMLFGKAWSRETGLDEEKLKETNLKLVLGLTFIIAYISSYNLAAFLGDPNTDWKWGTAAGLLAAFWAIAMYVIVSLFEQRTVRHMLINSGYMAVYFGVCGFLLGFWR
ncbi:MAG: DUF1761 domain-containing protein [Pyrinomonadaceae bacterium]